MIRYETPHGNIHYTSAVGFIMMDFEYDRCGLCSFMTYSIKEKDVITELPWYTELSISQIGINSYGSL